MRIEYQRKYCLSRRILIFLHRNNYGKTGASHQRFGITHTKETKEKMKQAHTGENNYNFGKKMSEEQKIKISKTKKAQHLIKLMSQNANLLPSNLTPITNPTIPLT